MRITVDELDVFKLSGPTHLVESGLAWSHPHTLSASMACLVQAVYALEKDRSMVKMGLPALAPDWYEPFKYKLVKVLRDDGESTDQSNDTIVGATFKWSRRLAPFRPAGAPKVVVAFRGTIPSVKSDLKADLDLLILQLHTTPRFKVALKEVENAVACYGRGKVCVTGHSLGAALCLGVGRSLAEEKYCFIEAHLFNPPFPSLHHFLSLKSLASAVVASFLIISESSHAEDRDGDHEPLPMADQKRAAHHHRLRQWLPHLYINTHDPVCVDYVAFMEHIESLLREGIKLPPQESSSRSASPSAYIKNAIRNKAAANNSNSYNGLRSLVQSWFGRETKAFHLIPSACLHVLNHASKQSIMISHGMKQWWSNDDIPLRLAGFGCSTST